MPETPPAAPMPTTFDRVLPRVYIGIVSLCALLMAGAQAEPDVIGQLQIPAGVVAIISALASQYKNTSNVEKAAKANPEHLASDDGHLDVTKTVARLLANAYENGDKTLVAALMTIPQQGSKK